MELILSKIKFLADQRKITVKRVSQELGITETDSLKVKTLEKIAEYLNVPLNYFFEENINIPEKFIKNTSNTDNVNITEINHENELLKEKLKSMEKENELLKEMIAMYKNSKLMML